MIDYEKCLRVVPYTEILPGDCIVWSSDSLTDAESDLRDTVRRFIEYGRTPNGFYRVTGKDISPHYSQSSRMWYYGSFVSSPDQVVSATAEREYINPVDYWLYAVVYRPMATFANPTLARKAAAFFAAQLAPQEPSDGTEDPHLAALTALYDAAYPDGEGEPSYRR